MRKTGVPFFTNRRRRFNWNAFKKNHLLMDYTIMLVPHSHKKPIHVKVPAGILAGAFFAIFVLLCCTTYFAYSSYSLHQVAVKNSGLKKISVKQTEQLELLQQESEDIFYRMEMMAEGERKIREKVGLDAVEDGKGGRLKTSADFSAEVNYTKPGDLSLQQELDGLEKKLDYLDVVSKERESKVAALDTAVDGRLHELDRMPRMWPVSGGRITSVFGSRDNPFGGSSTENHGAIDIACPQDTAIYAAGRGTVVTAGWENGYGNTVLIDHGNGYTSRYAHCSSLAVKAGDRIQTGQEIAAVGSTGRSTGPHVHFEVTYRGAVIDPEAVLMPRDGM